MSARYYLPLRHDEVAKTVLNSHLKKFYPSKEIKFSSEPEIVTHNKPDLIVWNRETKICSIIEFSCPLDININKKVNEKLENYVQLVRNLQIMYPDYKFQIASIVVGAMGSVPKCLTNYL